MGGNSTTVNSTISTNTTENSDDFALFTTNASGLYDGLTDETPINGDDNGQSDTNVEESTLNQVKDTTAKPEEFSQNTETDR